MQDKRKKEKPSDWELESSLEVSVTLEDLIGAPPFHEASDEHGHSVTAGTRIPLWLHRRVMKLKELPGSPYELNSDVLRDAVYLGLQILHARFKVSPDWAVERRMAAVADATGASRRVKEQFDELAAGLDEMCKDGDEYQAADKLSDYILAANELESSWHRGKIFRLLADSSAVQQVLQFCPDSIQRLVHGRKDKRDS